MKKSAKSSADDSGSFAAGDPSPFPGVAGELMADTAVAGTAESEPYLYLGRNLRHSRTVAGLTLRELANRVGCSESLLSKIENQKVLPSLQMLHRIVSHLDNSIGSLFTSQEMKSRIVLRQGERPVLTTGHSSRKDKVVDVKIEWVVPYPESKLLSGSIHKIAPQGGSQGKIAHKGEEVGYVLKGTFELTVEDETFLLDTGDSFFFASERPHGYRNPGDEETWVLWINTPPTF
jgi:quercetin dioxygenase-like cupin family protein/DNA-binding XRE family transcriptional regulator